MARALDEYRALQRRVELSADEAAREALRDQMDTLWYTLTDAERARLDGAS